MQLETRIACLSLAVFALASCDKEDKNAGFGSTSPPKSRVENRAKASTVTEAPPPGESGPAAGQRADPAETAPETSAAEQMIATFKSDGIAHMPDDVADAIIQGSNRAGTPEEQLSFINEQSAAWRRIEGFKESDNPIPDHMKRALVEKLSTKHGESWTDMAAELDEQLAASAKVDELRTKGIPGLSPDESQDLIIQALEKHAPDYKRILSALVDSPQE